MKITYIRHSGFLAELDGLYLLFDYIKGPLPELSEDKDLLVFVSHRHEDHFSPAIWDLADCYPRIRYILSDDIWQNQVPDRHFCRTEFMDPGMTLTLEEGVGTRVTAFHSTDEGVAFLAESGGHTLFHAGDLNNWHWKDESTPQEVAKAEGNFLKELDIIAKYTQAMDVVMFPVDPRLGTDFMRGAQQFIDRIKTGVFVPMHFWERPAEVMAFAPYAESKGCRYVVLSVPGEGTDI